jgi:pyruvate dehydrogenase E2 component (dihydrolipoamide acetyltransferase)
MTHRNFLHTSVLATPLARLAAAEHNVNLATLAGTGPRGRVTRRDVLSSLGLAVEKSSAAIQRHTPSPGELPPLTEQTTPGTSIADSIRDLSGAEQAIARRVAETKATVPDFQVQTEPAMDPVLGLRERLRGVANPPPSLNDFIIKAAAVALRDFPLVNASYVDGRFELHPRINIGVAVATDRMLMVPTVADADTRSLGSIAAETRRSAAAVRDSTIAPRDLAAPTFTISNLGEFEMTAITPIINAPQAASLGVGSLRTMLVRAAEEVVERKLLTLTLSCDHRILHATEAAQFLSRLRELLESPLLLA